MLYIWSDCVLHSPISKHGISIARCTQWNGMARHSIGVHDQIQITASLTIIAEWFLNHHRFWPIHSTSTTRLVRQIATLCLAWVGFFLFSLIRFHLALSLCVFVCMISLSIASQVFDVRFFVVCLLVCVFVCSYCFFFHSFLLLLLWFSDFLHLDRWFSSVILGGPIEMRRSGRFSLLSFVFHLIHLNFFVFRSISFSSF